MPSPFVKAVVVTAVVCAALGVAVLVPAGPGNVTNPYPSSVSAAATNGLTLTLTLNSTKLGHGGTLGVTVSEYNSLDRQNNISQASDWVVHGQLGSCADSVYPYGMAVYQGRVRLSNVSAASPVQVFPPKPCPLLIRLITGYVFQPLSQNATILPGTYSVQMSSQVTVSRSYTSPDAQGQPLSGTYTVAAVDEWGNAVFLYVTFG